MVSGNPWYWPDPRWSLLESGGYFAMCLWSGYCCRRLCPEQQPGDLAHDVMDMDQGVANINFRYERIFEYIYIQKTIRTNIRIYSYQKNDTNEYPNIFVSKKQYERISEYIRIKKMIRIWYERIFVSENIRIYSNIRIFATPWSGQSDQSSPGAQLWG